MVPALSLLSGCFQTDDSHISGTIYVCRDNDSLCVPRATLLKAGETLFQELGCSGCHGEKGEGSECPPLANSDYFMAVRLRPVSILLQGLSDSITVNGLPYFGFMPSLGLGMSNQEIASVLTYLRAGLNDSTVVSCGDEGCVKTPRSAAEIAEDSIAVWEVKRIRDSLEALPPM